MEYVQIVNGGGTSLNLLPPTSLNSGQIQYEDLYRTAKRNAEGVLIKNFVRTLTKINLTYSLITADEWYKMLNYMNSNQDFFVKFFDPKINSMRTIKMYSGNRAGTPYMVDKNTGKPLYYTSVTQNLIEI